MKEKSLISPTTSHIEDIDQQILPSWQWRLIGMATMGLAVPTITSGVINEIARSYTDTLLKFNYYPEGPMFYPEAHDLSLIAGGIIALVIGRALWNQHHTEPTITQSH